MHTTSSNEKTQADLLLNGRIDAFFDRFNIGTLLHRCGVRKRHGAGVRSVMQAIFALPFIGKNFYRGIVLNDELLFGKDAAYDLLKTTRANWRRLILNLCARIHRVIETLTSDPLRAVLILDDTTYDRSRSKHVELLSRVYDHTTKRLLKGFRMLSLGWSDGNSYLPVDFILLSASEPKKRLHDADKTLDRRCCAYQRRQEAVLKATEHLEAIIRRAREAGIEAAHLVMDSWFTMPATVAKLSGLINVIGMLKHSPKIHYRFQEMSMDLAAIHRKIRKRPGKAKIIGTAMVSVADKVQAKILFVRNRHHKGWLALLSTDTQLSNEDIIRIHGKRWDIEVFFKMAKQHLKLSKEIQCRDFEALIAHTSIVFARYMFIAWQVRLQTDERTFGDLFFACCNELADISFIEALHRLLTLALDRLQALKNYCEYTAQALIDEIMGAAASKTALSCGFQSIANANPES